jgi:sugar lactone lactonase YvrE
VSCSPREPITAASLFHLTVLTFITWRIKLRTGTLYRVSKLGGSRRKILDDVNTGVTFSPDGAWLAFVRTNRALDTPDLMVAKANGMSERILARRTRAEADTFMSDMKRASPVWSPDGKVLVCPTLSCRLDRR